MSNLCRRSNVRKIGFFREYIIIRIHKEKKGNRKVVAF